MFSLKNKTAVVTGGGSGIGRAIAELFAAQGASTFILEVNKSNALDAVNVIEAKGGKAKAFEADVTNQSQVREIIGSIAKESGRIDILVNSAGISHIGKLESTSEEDFEKVFR